MNNLIFASALFFLFLGFLFVYKPTLLMQINKIAREKIFNDTIVLLERRKRGTFFLLISFILFWWGYYRGQYDRTELTEKLISPDRLLYQSLQHLYSKQYLQAKNLAERVLMQEPQNADALYQLAAAQFLLNDQAAGESAWAKAKQLDSHSPQAQRLSDLISQIKNSPRPK